MHARHTISMKAHKKAAAGWVGVAITVVISSLWAYWGAIENFHEGWYSTSMWENLFMLLFQYLLFTLVFISLALIALRWRRIGLAVHIAAAGFSYWFFSGASFSVVGLMIVIPIIALGLLYYVGEPRPKKWAYRIIIIIPVLIILALSLPNAIRISQRVNDRDFGLRIVAGNGVTLAWAPRGPGWPDAGTSWQEAQRVCTYLSEDGTTIMQEAQNFWRLPTADEAVRSMMLHGENAKGIWNPEQEKAVYERTPDKETPLWDVHSKVIYYWTADASPTDDRSAYIIVYHGGVYPKRKTEGQSYLSFRAVREVEVGR